MMTLSLAIRNLLRNRRRSLATLLALAIGSTAILLFGGYSSNIGYSMLTGYVRSGGHLQVQFRDFFLYGSGNPTAYGIPDYARIIDAIRDDEVLKKLVTVVTPTLQFGGIAGNYEAGVSRTVSGAGFIAKDVSQMRRWDEFRIGMDSPAYVLDGAPQDAAIVGVGLARVLLLCQQLRIADCPSPQADSATATGPALPADIAALALLEAPAAKAAPATEPRIELLAGHSRGSPNVAALRVLTAESQGFKELDEVAVVLQLEQAQKLVYGRVKPQATSIMVQLASTASIPQASAQLQMLLAREAPQRPLAVLDFVALNPFYVQTLQLFDTIFGFIFVLIGGIVLFTVSNTMNAAVVERTVEIGTLRAVGLRQGGIRKLFVTEGFVIGCVGALVGALAAVVIAGAINLMGLTWLPPGSSEPLPLTLRVWGEWPMLIGTTLGLIVIAVASAWWPAWRAARLKIVEALRHA